MLPVVVILIGIYVYFFWTCCPEPATERLRASCQVEGGFFVEELEQCQLPASDAGKTCKDSSECEGFCEADLSPDEISKITNGNEWKNGRLRAVEKLLRDVLYNRRQRG